MCVCGGGGGGGARRVVVAHALNRIIRTDRFHLKHIHMT